MERLAGKKVAIFDLDDTLSDTSHRQHFMEKGPDKKKDVAAFFAACDADPERPAFIEMLHEAKAAGLEIVILSGRADSTKSKTRKWLAARGIEPALTMLRPWRCFLKSHVMKGQWLDQLKAAGAQIAVAYDDEDRNIEAFRAAGIRVIDAKHEANARAEHDQFISEHKASFAPASAPKP